jgi:hypothetical protein
MFRQLDLVSSSTYDGRWTKSKNPVIPNVIHHPQNPLGSTYEVGRAIAQAVSHLFSTAAALVPAQVRSRGICGGQSDPGTGFLRVLSPANSHSTNRFAGFPPLRPRFEPRASHVGFVVDKVALGQLFSECFGFPCQFSFHRPLHTHHLSSGTGTIGQIAADVPSGLSLTPPKETKKK